MKSAKSGPKVSKYLPNDKNKWMLDDIKEYNYLSWITYSDP